MLTNFKVNRDTLDRMDGNSQEEMHHALRDWMSLASEQRTLLWNFEHMVEVITLEDVPRIQNANLILKVIHHHLDELQKFFHLKPAHNVLATSATTVASLIEDAEQWTPRILRFVPGVSTSL